MLHEYSGVPLQLFLLSTQLNLLQLQLASQLVFDSMPPKVDAVCGCWLLALSSAASLTLSVKQDTKPQKTAQTSKSRIFIDALLVSLYL
jgi:hypothetical protein